jgi:NadR type nicotinamide-nucleotide adenylyltransferase
LREKRSRGESGKLGRVLRVVVSGPESTGKTTLARRLAEHYRTAWSPEFVREYLEARQPRDPPSLVLWEDIEPIARGQLEAEAAAARRAREVMFCDTDLHSTRVYAEHYFGRCPEWIARAARERSYDLHLLLRNDLPWAADALRDRPDPEQRERLLAAFRDELRRAGRRVVEIEGAADARFEAALRAVAQLMAGG